MTTTIYHNPRCSKSRQALELLESQGADIEVIRYLETPPDAATLVELLERLGLSARELMRKGEDTYKELNLANPEVRGATGTGHGRLPQADRAPHRDP